MQYLVLATDYDGTLADNGRVDRTTLAALERVRQSGRKIVLVTGREVPELHRVFPRLDLCDLVVAENGGLLYWPAEKREQALAEPPPAEFLTEMRRLKVEPCSIGRVVFATWRPHEVAIAPVIERLGIDYQIVFNKRAVMVLPSNVNKASGLAAALGQLKIASERVVGIGDAENDLAFLEACGLAVAVANALPELKPHCDLVTPGDHGRGVCQLVEMLLADDLRSLGPHQPRAKRAERPPRR
jgi:hydroxymethylpyrimidine pyrophosphatase-like HAD family hydrolase